MCQVGRLLRRGRGGCVRALRPFAPTGGLAQKRFVPLDFGFGVRDLRGHARVLVGRNVTSELASPIDGVPEFLRSTVHRLPTAEQIEAQLAFVDCFLCGASRAIQLILQLVPQSHGSSSRFTVTTSIPRAELPENANGAPL